MGGPWGKKSLFPKETDPSERNIHTSSHLHLIKVSCFGKALSTPTLQQIACILVEIEAERGEGTRRDRERYKDVFLQLYIYTSREKGRVTRRETRR